MARSGNSSWNRRDILRTAGISVVGVAALSPRKAARAQSSPASIRVEDQEIDGDTVVLAAGQTEVESRLIVISDHQVDGTNINYRTIELEAGEEFTDRTVELSEPIPETQRIRAEIRTIDGSDELLARDGALVAVGESLSAVDPQDRIRTGPNVELVEADSDAGFHYPYFLYTPEMAEDAERPIVVQPNNSPSADDDYAVHLENAHNAIRGLTNLCDPLQSPGLVPAFPRFRNEPVPWSTMIQSLDPNTLELEEPPLERVDRQLIRMLEDAVERLESEGYAIADEIHMNGFSQSATFTNRFTILHPGRVNAVTCGGNGFGVLPRAELDGQTLPYPAGIADLEELIGEEFNLDTWRDVDQYIFVGDEDQPLPEDGTRGYRGFEHLGEEMNELMIDIFGENRVTERFPVTRSVYTEAGASAEFRVYEGVGHRTTPEINADIIEFHKANMNVSRDEATDEPDSEAQRATEAKEVEDTPAEDSEPGSEKSESTTESLPGFGLLEAIAALGGVSYLVKRRLTPSE